MSETGTATVGMNVVRMFRRKTNTTRTTNTTARARASSTSRMEERIVVVRSITISVFIAGDIDASNDGSNARTRSTVEMMFAPGWRKMIRGMVCFLWTGLSVRL